MSFHSPKGIATFDATGEVGSGGGGGNPRFHSPKGIATFDAIYEAWEVFLRGLAFPFP